MSKAITGLAELGAAAVIAGGMVFPPTAEFFNNPIFYKMLTSLVIAGVSSEAGAAASALTENRGMGITTRQTAAARQIVYGQQRVGGVEIYRSTTGSSHDQFNYIIVLAGHEIDSIQNLYLDGRQVHWQGSGNGWSVRNGVGFGGVADANSYTGPNGVQYNFGGVGHSGIYCEARYGDQLDGDVMASLTANDPIWVADGLGNSPWVAGCAYVYLKIEYNTNVFPGEPEIRFTVNGKNNIYDPRTNTTGFTSNWALITADVVTDPIFGLGDNTVNQAQLIAAANVCDEQVALAAIPGTSESRYTTNYHYDTTVSPGNVIATMMDGAVGRISRIGGEWFLWPSYWQGPSFTFDQSDLTGNMQWEPNVSFKDLINRITGTYIAPTFPFNITGNLYDQNGFYNGQAQDNFPFAFQPTNFPEYAQDPLHGYASDQWLNEDGGTQLPKDVSFQTVLSVTQAQRCAKIMLLRNRFQGSGTFPMNLAAWRMQPLDVMQFTFAQNGWLEKSLEISGVSFSISEQGDGGVQTISAKMSVQETDASIYEWSTSEELTVYDVAATPAQTTYDPAPPTSMSLTSGANTAIINADGSVSPRIEVQWDTPEDVLTKQIQIQYQQVGASVWLSAPTVDVSLNLGYITGVIAGQQYNVRIRSARANGAISAWEEIDGYTESITLSVENNLALAPGSLVAEAYPDGTAAIDVSGFTATIGMLSVSILPGGQVQLTGLLQSTLYWVYYIDPTFAGGAITPIATTTSSDFLNKVGYFLIDSVITPSANSSGGGGTTTGRYSPSSFSDVGTRTTSTPAAAYDGNLGSAATVSGVGSTPSGASPASATVTKGNCTWLGFISFVTTAAMTLSVTAGITATSNGGCNGQVEALVNGVSDILLSSSSTVASAAHTVAIPIGTNLNTISILVTADPPSTVPAGTSVSVSVAVAEISIS